MCSADITGVLSTAVWLLPASPDRIKSVNSLWHGDVLRCAVLGLSVQQELPGILHEVSFLGVKRRLLLDNLLNRTDTHIASVSSLRSVSSTLPALWQAMSDMRQRVLTDQRWTSGEVLLSSSWISGACRLRQCRMKSYLPSASCAARAGLSFQAPKLCLQLMLA